MNLKRISFIIAVSFGLICIAYRIHIYTDKVKISLNAISNNMVYAETANYDKEHDQRSNTNNDIIRLLSLPDDNPKKKNFLFKNKLEQMPQVVNRTYDYLFKKLNLDQQKQKTLTDLLVTRLFLADIIGKNFNKISVRDFDPNGALMVALVDYPADASEKNLSTINNSPDVVELDSLIKKLLGENDFSVLSQYMIDYRIIMQVVNPMQNEIRQSGFSALTNEQSDQLIELVSIYRPTVNDNRFVGVNVISAEALERSKVILTSQQNSVLEKLKLRYEAADTMISSAIDAGRFTKK